MILVVHFGSIDHAYYGTYTRMGGLLLGAAFAFYFAPYRIRGLPGHGARIALDVAGAAGLAPGAQFDQIAARLLNYDATGASLIDQDVFNGTTSTIYLTVTVTRPVMVMAAQSFVLGNAPTNVTAATCGDACNIPVEGPTYSSPTIPNEATTLHFPVKVFELVAGVPTTEVPCLAPCPPSGTTFKFAIPPRPSGGQPARAFRVMTMIGQISSLYPTDQFYQAAPPFEDAAITWTSGSGVTTTTRFTGSVGYSNDPNRTGCVKFVFPPNGPPVCTQEGTLVPYRALRSATLTFSSNTNTLYETAATASQIPARAHPDRTREAKLSWATSEGALP
jgi:hypothetical protein